MQRRLQVNNYNKNNNPISGHLFPGRPLFFVLSIFLSSYLPLSYPELNILFISILSLILLIEIYDNNYLYRQLLLIVICILLVLSLKIYFLLSICVFLYYISFSDGLPIPNFIWKVAILIQPLIVAISILHYWGLPGGILLIWFWGAPLIIFSILIIIFFNRLILPILLILCGILLYSNEILKNNFNNKILSIVDDQSPGIVDNKSLSVITNNFDIIKFNKTFSFHKPGKYIISLVNTNIFNDSFFKKNDHHSNEYYIFAEHDNLSNFLTSDSDFNNDSFIRKSPWIAFKPIFRYDLQIASNKDPLYCSNIGCTIHYDFSSYPLIWSYNNFGSPIILAQGTFYNNKRIVLIGDSDPIIPFLAPYNPELLRALLGIPDYRYFILGSAIIFFGLSILYYFYQRKIYILFIGVSLFCLLLFNIAPSMYEIVVDTNILISDTIYSPHYDTNYSSLPKKLVENNVSVSINNKNCKSLINIYIINKYKIIPIKLPSTTTNIVFVMPNKHIKYNSNIISCDDIACGSIKNKLKSKYLIIEDARTLSINDNKLNSPIYIEDNNIFIGTGSPQYNINLIKNILDENK
jgi:hypothetical protein